MLNQLVDPILTKPVDCDNRAKSRLQEMRSLSDDISPKNSVILSNTSRQLEALKKSLQDVPEINEARVLYFKAEIELGNYKINSDNIARSMLNNVEIA